MKTLKNIVAVAAILTSSLFLANVNGDIQLGFGLVLLVQGLLGLTK